MTNKNAPSDVEINILSKDKRDWIQNPTPH